MRSFLVWLIAIAAGGANAAIIDVTVSNNAFSPRQVSVQVGDTVRWTLQGSGGGYGEIPGVAHNVVADDGSFNSGAPLEGPWTFTHQFTEAGDFPYYCSAHGAPGGIGMSGAVQVSAAALQINEGMAGAWYNPLTTGQGFFFDVHPGSALLGLAWFTWTDTPGEYDWLTGVGRFTGNQAEIQLTRTEGGQFNTPLAVTDGEAGGAIITFSSCTAARIEFSLTAPPRTGAIDLVKLLPLSPLCQAPAR